MKTRQDILEKIVEGHLDMLENYRIENNDDGAREEIKTATRYIQRYRQSGNSPKYSEYFARLTKLTFYIGNIPKK